MYKTDESGFDKIVSWAMDALPKSYISNLRNVAIVIEDLPSQEQRHKLKLSRHSTLFGLYEGVPLSQRGNSYSLVLPDKITLFKKPLEHFANSLDSLMKQVKKTLWHEIAHYYGLNHADINRLETK